MMAAFKHTLIKAGFSGFAATRVHRLVGPLTRGAGAILTFHNVRPWLPRAFAPNRALEITPDYLDAALGRIKALGFRIIGLDQVLTNLESRASPPFVALTFDDGYHDTLIHALPVLERHGAPFTVFVTTGFADRQAPLWWLDLEDLIRDEDRLAFDCKGEAHDVPLRTLTEKRRGFDRAARGLRRQPHGSLLSIMAALRHAAGRPAPTFTANLCMDWAEIQRLAAHPLATIGCHTLSHANLAMADASALKRELAESRSMITARIGRPVLHLAYPYGSPEAAGPREFGTAAALGFATGVTTRPGTLVQAHADHPTALPRISVNGLWQDLDVLDILLSGAPFALWNRGRRVTVG